MASLAAGGLGGMWLTGLSILARGIWPQIQVVGSDSWQLILVQNAWQRILILAGEFESFPESPARRLLGILRPTVDLVAGRQEDLDLLRATPIGQLAGSARIVLDREVAQGDPNRTVAMGYGLSVTLEPFRMRFSPIHAGEWRNDPPPHGWLTEIDVDGLIIAIGPRLDLLARRANARTRLAIAPGGNIAYLHRFLPDVAVATNAASTDGIVVDSTGTDVVARETFVVPTFANDVATFEIRHGTIRMPPWTASLGPDSW